MLARLFSAHSLTSSFGKLVTSSCGDTYSVCTAEVSKQEDCSRRHSETVRLRLVDFSCICSVAFVVGLHLLVASGWMSARKP